jgi:glycosyltransferase involved in cell wall biosynthesis
VKPINVLQIHSSPSPGGGTVHVRELAAELAERGHSVHVACRASGHLPRLLESSRARIHTFPLRGGLDFLSVVQVAALVKRQGIDILHAHSGRDYALCRMVHRIAGRGRMVFSRHLLKANRPRWLARRTYASAARTITVSDAVRSLLIRELDLHPGSLVTIPNWLDMERFTSLPEPEQAREAFGLKTRYVVGVIGSLIPIKGQEEFIRAAALVAREEEDVTFAIIGNEAHAEKEYVAGLHALAESLELGDRLRFVDWVKDIRSILPALTVSVVPSWRDAFSLVVIESMAAGIPVVAAAAGGPGEIVDDQITGLLVEPRSEKALAGALTRLLNDGQLRQRLSLAASRVVADRFDQDRVISRIEALYYDVVKG